MKQQPSQFGQAQQLEQNIVDLKTLVQELVDGLQDCWDNEYSLEALNDLKARAQDLLAEKEQ